MLYTVMCNFFLFYEEASPQVLSDLLSLSLPDVLSMFFVFARVLGTFDVDLCTLLGIVAHDVDETFAEHRDAVPFRVLAGFTGRTVFPALRSGDAKACDLAIAFAQRANFGICAEIADEDNLVH